MNKFQQNADSEDCDIQLAPKFGEYSERLLVKNQIKRGIRFERYEGSDILDAVNDKKINIIGKKEKVFHVFALQIFNILRKMHKIGVHRDMKLENIIVLDKKKGEGNGNNDEEYQFRIVVFNSFLFLGENHK